MMAAVMLKAMPTFLSALSQKLSLNSAVANKFSKLSNQVNSPYDGFHNKFRNCKPPKKEYIDYKKLVGSDLTKKFELV